MLYKCKKIKIKKSFELIPSTTLPLDSYKLALLPAISMDYITPPSIMNKKGGVM